MLPPLHLFPTRTRYVALPHVLTELAAIVNTCQELGSMYDYLAKVILLGPSGAGK
jgi:hypothetical protein